MEYFGVSTRLFDHFVLISCRSDGGILTCCSDELALNRIPHGSTARLHVDLLVDRA